MMVADLYLYFFIICFLDPEGNVVKDIHNDNPNFLKYKFSFNDVDSGK